MAVFSCPEGQLGQSAHGLSVMAIMLWISARRPNEYAKVSFRAA